MQQPARLFEAPEDILFSLKEITYTPESPRKEEPFTVKGKMELFGIPLLVPVWIKATVSYPERWWEEITPIIGAREVREFGMATGGEFTLTFKKGFIREGKFGLAVRLYPGPSFPIDTMVFSPTPAFATEETTFIVGGEIPPEEVGFRNFRILSYSKNGGEPVTPPGVLELDVGDRCRVNVGFDHMDGEVTGKYHAAIWQQRVWDPHDEILNDEKVFSVPSSPDWVPVEDSIDIIITSAISPGSEYGLYVKIMGITGGDIFTEYLANVITITGAPPTEADIKDFDFKLTKGSYDIGAKVPFTAPYDYKGPEQDGQLTISIGTGIYPTFSPVYTYEPIPVEFPAAGDWETRGLEGTITLPDTLEPGQTYSIRAKLETLTVPTQETDTDWSAFDIIEVYEGTINKKQLEYNGTRGTIPVSGVPYDKRGLVHIWGRNDTAKNQTLGIGWVVTDPDGSVVERHENDWAAGWVGANQDREFIGGRFDMDKAGTYRIAITLYMNSGNPVGIDSYDGTLCTVTEAPAKEAPIITTLSAINITHNSSTLKASLVRKGYCGVINCHIEWGTTTAYGYKSPERGMEVGNELAVDIAGLTPNTTYHFRAVAAGRCVTPPLIGYGSDMTFTTSAEVVKGFTMRVINPPAGATDWIAGAVAGGTLPHMVNRIGIYETWVWDKDVPDYAINFHLMVVDAVGHSLHSMEWDYFLLRDGKDYVYNCATQQMMES